MAVRLLEELDRLGIGFGPASPDTCLDPRSVGRNAQGQDAALSLIVLAFGECGDGGEIANVLFGEAINERAASAMASVILPESYRSCADLSDPTTPLSTITWIVNIRGWTPN